MNLVKALEIDTRSRVKVTEGAPEDLRLVLEYIKVCSKVLPVHDVDGGIMK